MTLPSLVPATDDRRTGPPFVVWCPPPGWGFFANFFWILDGVSLAERNGWCPVVDMQRHKTRFNERRPVHGSIERVGVLLRAAGRHLAGRGGDARPATPRRAAARRVLLDADRPRRRPTSAGRPRHREEACSSSGTSAFVPTSPRSVDALLPDVDATRTLGVHVRGTDMRRPDVPGHPIPPPARAYLDAALGIASDRSVDRVYLGVRRIGDR